MEERTYNGTETDIAELAELASRDARRLSSRSISVIEKVNEHLPPFEQKSHDLLLKSIDQVADHWIEQLEQLRDNTKAIERMVLEVCAKAKDDVTRLHLAGAGVVREVNRGQGICQNIADEVDRIMAA